MSTNRHKGMVRGFYHLSESYYGKANLEHSDFVDEIMVGFYGENGNEGTTGEFAIRWGKLGRHISPQLQVYDDAWETLTHFFDLLTALAAVDGKDIPPASFRAILIGLGLKDLTRRGCE